MIQPYSTDLCGFCYVSFFNDFLCICCHMCSWESKQIHKSKIESLNSRCWNYNCQQLYPPAKASSGFKRYELEQQPVYSFATGRNLVGTSPTCSRHEILKFLILWLDLALLVTTPLKLLKKRTGFVAVHWSETVQIWSNFKGKEKPSCKEINLNLYNSMTRTLISSTGDYKRCCLQTSPCKFFHVIFVRQTTCWWDLISVDFQLFVS